MPVSAIQHRLTTAYYHDNSCKNKREKDLESINSNSSVNIHDFSSYISHIENSSGILSPSSTSAFIRRGAMATTLQLMLLFNVLNRSDAACFADKENSLSIMDNDSALAKRNYFIESNPVSMSVADGGHVSSQPLLLPEIAQARASYANSNSTLFINENSHIHL